MDKNLNKVMYNKNVSLEDLIVADNSYEKVMRFRSEIESDKIITESTWPFRDGEVGAVMFLSVLLAFMITLPHFIALKIFPFIKWSFILSLLNVGVLYLYRKYVSPSLVDEKEAALEDYMKTINEEAFQIVDNYNKLADDEDDEIFVSEDWLDVAEYFFSKDIKPTWNKHQASLQEVIEHSKAFEAIRDNILNENKEKEFAKANFKVTKAKTVTTNKPVTKKADPKKTTTKKK